MASIPAYRAEMIGLSERDRTLLRSFLAASQARTGVRWDGGPQAPAIHFIDLEGQAGADFWQSLSETDRRDAAVVISSAPPSDGVRWLAKPLRSNVLIAVLEQMMSVARAPAAPAATPAAPARAPKPGAPQTLLDVLDGVGGAIGARTVQSPHWPDLVLGNGNTHAMRTAEFEQYVDGFSASLEFSRVGKYTGGPMNDELRIEIETLRWLALLYAPINEIADRLPYPKRAKLRNVPAFGNLPHKLHHIRMAAALVQHPATPAELAEIGGVDAETVHRFLGACAAVGLLEVLAEIVAPRPTPPPLAQRVASLIPPVRFTAPPAPAEPVADPVVESAPEPEPVVAAADEQQAPPAASAEPPEETPVAYEQPAPAESVSVLEKLRAAREQNRARVAAAIRSVSGQP